MRCIPQEVRSRDDVFKLCSLSFANFTVQCSLSYPTPEVLDALWSFNISAFWTPYFSGIRTLISEFDDISTSRASQLPDFFTWLKDSGSSKKGQDLYAHYISTWDEYMRHRLMEISPGLLGSNFIFYVLEDVHSLLALAASDATRHKILSNISSTLNLLGGDRRYRLWLAGFFGDPSRSGPFYLDGDKYANFAITFTKHILFPSNRSNWERDLPHLSNILSKASYSKELADLLDSELLNMIKVRRRDLAQTAADIVRAYCDNSHSSDNRCVARHIEDSDAVIRDGTLNYDSASKGPDQRAGNWIKNFLGWLSSNIRCL